MSNGELQEAAVSESVDQNDDDEQQIQRRKRTRKDSGMAREYECPCGKNYLSYPALYTHIKQKHNGIVKKKSYYIVKKAPGEIHKPSHSHYNHSYYQAKNPQTSLTSQSSESGQEQQDGHLQSPTLSQTGKFDIQQVVGLLKIEGQQVGERRKLSFQEVKQLLAWEITADFLFQSETEKLTRNSNYYKTLLEQYKESKNPVNSKLINLSDLQFNVQTKLYDININNALVLFLKDVESYLNPLQYQLLCVFIYLIRRTLNDIYLQGNLLQNNLNQDEQEPCESLHPKDIGEVCNFFVVVLVPQYLQQINQLRQFIHVLQVLQLTQVIEIINNLAYKFCGWLYYRQFSHHQLCLKQK